MERRESLTIRFPGELLSEAKEIKEERQSLNDFVVEAVEHEVRRRRALLADERIARVREQVRAETGVHPDSAPLIREMREEIGRRD